MMYFRSVVVCRDTQPTPNSINVSHINGATTVCVCVCIYLSWELNDIKRSEILGVQVPISFAVKVSWSFTNWVCKNCWQIGGYQVLFYSKIYTDTCTNNSEMCHFLKKDVNETSSPVTVAAVAKDVALTFKPLLGHFCVIKICIFKMSVEQKVLLSWLSWVDVKDLVLSCWQNFKSNLR